MKTVIYNLNSDRLEKDLRIALVSDLHGSACDDVLRGLEKSAPDIIAVTGDITSRLDCEEGNIPPNDYGKSISHVNAFRLLRESASIAPTYYSLGNHELCGHKYRQNHGRKCLKSNLELIKQSGAVLLDDTYTDVGGLRIGGLTSGFYVGARRHGKTPPPATAFLQAFADRTGEKLLLCHHPEYYPTYIRHLPIRLTVAGHAHGGQWRVGGRGIFAPGQGLFPKLTDGLYEERLLISRGLSNPCGIPRFGNPPQLVTVTLAPNAEYTKSL